MHLCAEVRCRAFLAFSFCGYNCGYRCSKSVGTEQIGPPEARQMGLTIKEIENAKPLTNSYKLADGRGLWESEEFRISSVQHEMSVIIPTSTSHT